MKVRTNLLITCAAGALVLGAGLSNAFGADQAAIGIPAAVGWWFHGDVEIGGRFHAHKNGSPTTCLSNTIRVGAGAPFSWNCFATRHTLGRFYEFRDWREGPYGNIVLATGSNDGLYQIGFWANNIGYNDQGYFLDFSKVGEHYLSVGYDEIPRFYNRHATTIYDGVGSNVLSLPNAFRTTVRANTNAAIIPDTNLRQQNVLNAINSNLKEFHLGFKRETAAVDYRWTPSPDWDVKIDYAHMVRDGTQSMGALALQGAGSGGASRISLELPKPISDTTDNANASAEYAGITPWGKRFNITAGYGLSVYRNDFSGVLFQNPFVPDVSAGPNDPLWSQISLQPDNSAHMFRLNGAVDLPFRSRYVGAMQYSVARQNEAFLPFTVNPLVVPVPAPAISQASLNGESQTVLINNVLTTQITPELKSTVRYRYYDYINETPDTTITNFIVADTNAVFVDTLTKHGAAYIKQNASGELVWNPFSARWLTIGGSAGWERWDRDHRDANVTDEWLARVFLNAKLWDWGQFRSSYLHTERRYDSYIPMVESNATNAARSTYRLFDMANRDRDKGNFFLDVYLPNNVTVTPTGGFRYDDYKTNPFALVALNSVGVPRGELGLLDDSSWNAGIEISWAPSRLVNFMASYTHEASKSRVMSNSNVAMLEINVRDTQDTFLFGTNVAVIPDKFDVKAALTYTRAVATFAQNGGGIAPVSNAVLGTSPNIAPFNTFLTAFPNQILEFTRVDIQGKYKFDPTWTRQLGWNGEVYAKLRYIWEHSDVEDWATVNQNYLVLIGGGANDPYRRSIHMGWNNPNYNIHLVMAALGFRW